MKNSIFMPLILISAVTSASNFQTMTSTYVYDEAKLNFTGVPLSTNIKNPQNKNPLITATTEEPATHRQSLRNTIFSYDNFSNIVNKQPSNRMLATNPTFHRSTSKNTDTSKNTLVDELEIQHIEGQIIDQYDTPLGIKSPLMSFK